MKNKTLTKVEQELENITNQLEILRIEYENNRKSLLRKREKVISNNNHKKVEVTKEKNCINTFKIGQRVQITNNYSRDYGVSGKGIIGIVYQVNKIQVSLKAESNQKYYTRSYKNLVLLDE
jgi:hypothetical protein